jgi:UDP-N-acetyl-D-mannosaminuronate dehydrogenase
MDRFGEVSAVSLEKTSMANSLAEELKTKIREHSVKAGVVGLGYVGLPLALEMARVGFRVTGIDLVKEKVDQVNAGNSYILDVPTETLRSAVSANKMRATQSLAAVHRGLQRRHRPQG